MTINTVCFWRCKCGMRVKVASETDRDKPMTTMTAACPNCANERTIFAHRIISIINEKEEYSYSETTEDMSRIVIFPRVK